MKRFFGMMPVSEIEKTVTFKDKYGHKVRIDAGPNGWTVRYADMGSNYADESIGTEQNFKNAYAVAEEKVGPLEPLHGKGLRGLTRPSMVLADELFDEPAENADAFEEMEETQNETYPASGDVS